MLLALVMAACSASTPVTTELPTAPSAGTTPIATNGPSPPRSPGAEGEATSEELIADAVQRGEIDEERGLLYSVFAAFGDPRLPAQYVGAPALELEPSIDLATLEASLGSFSPEVRDQIAPFLIPPINAGSWWDQRHNATRGVIPAAGARVAAPQSLLPILDDHWSSVLTGNGRVRIWHPAGDFELGRLAGSTKTEIDAVIWPRLVSLMGFEPLPDQGGANPAHGPDNALDLILQNDTRWAATIGRAPNLCERTSAWILLDPRVVTDLEVPWNAAVAHELMHAFQFALDLQTLAGGPGGCSDSEYVWWAEATATWAEDHVYPSSNSEWAGKRGTDNVEEFMTTVGRSPTVSTFWTNRGAWGRSYGAYLFPFYLARRFGDAVVADAWRRMSSSESEPAIQAAITSANGGSDLETVWADFAVALLNEAPLDYLKQQDGITHRPLEIERVSGRISSTVDQIDHRIWLGDDYEAVGLHDGSVSVEWYNGSGVDANVGLNAPALTYSHYRFDDPKVRSVGWFNGMTFERVDITADTGTFWSANPRPEPDVAGLRVQALLRTAGGDWTLEDWTTFPWRSFCRDVSTERLTELVIIVSNGRPDEEFVESPPIIDPDRASRLWVSDMGCYRWQGTVRFEQHNGNFHLTIDAEDVVLERDTENSPFGTIGAISYRAVEGRLRWRLSNSDENCTEEGDGTSTIDSSLAVTTMNFFVDGPWYRAGGGQLTGADGENIPITCAGEAMEPHYFTPIIPIPADGSPGRFEDGARWTGTSTHSDSNVVVTWDLTAVAE